MIKKLSLLFTGLAVIILLSHIAQAPLWIAHVGCFSWGVYCASIK